MTIIYIGYIFLLSHATKVANMQANENYNKKNQSE